MVASRVRVPRVPSVENVGSRQPNVSIEVAPLHTMIAHGTASALPDFGKERDRK